MTNHGHDHGHENGLWRPIDIYCERVDPSFWAEPLNAISNAAFIIGAVLAVALHFRRGEAPDATEWVLAALVTITGIGSFLFHTFAVVWASLADVIPIVISLLTFFYVCQRRFFAATHLRCAIGTLLFLASHFALMAILPDGFANGSGIYFPTLFSLYLGWFVLRTSDAAGAGAFLTTALLFTVSITFRSLDMALCDVIPYGVHIFWHILNGACGFVALNAVMRRGRPGEAAV